MCGQRMSALSVLLVAALAGGMVGISTVIYSEMPNKLSYKQFVPIRDPERRQRTLPDKADDKLIDTSAFVGMPDAYSALVSEYVDAAISAIKAAPITRRRYYHKDRVRGPDDKIPPDPFPDDANPIYDREVNVPLVVFPRPNAVRRWASSNQAHALGWIAEDKAIQNRGSVYGRTLIFEPGKLSQNPYVLPAAPFESFIPSWDAYVPEQDSSYSLELGKIVVTPSYDSVGLNPVDDTEALQLGEKGGAILLAELLIVPAYVGNFRLRWASVGNGSNARRFLAYMVVDGNGARRRQWIDSSAGPPVSQYVRPLRCDLHQPKSKQHDQLLLPTPLGWAPTSSESKYSTAHEEWCLDDWFPAQKDTCWVIREAEDSKPLQESFLLMPASEKSDRPVFFIALFAEAEPKQLIKELAALYNVSADKALSSPDTMARLQSLYEKVRDFPLDK
ncbi:MAG: hypothetical protein JWP89_2998 [Schlesneria sp.]|nr:hypothetical protein [Schlesneria sp.]